jgi:conjugal transfer pilus assembly protein TraD
MTHALSTDLLRPVVETIAAIAWLAAAAHGASLAVWCSPACVGTVITAGAVVMCVWRSREAWRRYAFKLALGGHPVQRLPSAALDAQREALADQVWLGWGFRWQTSHAQLAHDILRHDLREIAAPAWLRALARSPDPARARGLSWLHGLAPEEDVVVPLRALEGHTAVMAVTGAMKTVFARLLVHQLAARGDTVLVFDPKGDRDLEAVCRAVPRALGEAERFVSFLPAFGARSIRFDALACWDRATQVASRLRLLLPGQDDNFIGFAWMVTTHVVQAQAYVGRRASLASLLEAIRSPAALNALAMRALDRFFAQSRPGSRTDAKAPERLAPRSHRQPPNPAQALSQVIDGPLAAAIARFLAEVPASEQPNEITGLLSVLACDRTWFDKMSVTLTPLLTRLTAGDLQALLSPDHDDVDDARPIFTSRRLVEGRHVAYFGLDALSDPAVAEAIVALVLADLAATAGELYKHAPDAALRQRRIHVLCDEWGDVACDPLVQLANKARGAGVVLYLFGQTFSDLVVKMGDVHKARRVLGNMNNLIVGATSDPETLEIVAAKLGETVVRRSTFAHGATHGLAEEGGGLRASSTVSIGEQDAALVPGSLLMGLPDLHCFAVVDRAQVHKLRIPVLEL